MRGRAIALSLLVGVILPAGSALASTPKPPSGNTGSIGIRLIGVPAANLRADPLARLYIAGGVAPGTRVRRRVEVSNSTSSTASVAVYPAAAGIRQGSFAFAPGRSRNELSSWTSVSRGVLPVLPGANALETVTIHVPRDAAPGERYGVIWAQVSVPAAAAGGVRLVNRVGVRMYVAVAAGGSLPPNFDIGPLTVHVAANGQPLVLATVRNSGRRTLDISGNLTLTGSAGGLRAGRYPVTLATALPPNASEQATVRLGEGFPRGPWHARLRLSSGFIERSAAATLTFPGQPAVTAAPARSRGVIRNDALLTLLLAIAAFGLAHLRRMSSRERASRDQ